MLDDRERRRPGPELALPPDAALAYHWGAALSFNVTGAGECLQAQQEKNSSVLRSAAGYITDGALQVGYSTSDIEAQEGLGHP